ncbi:hypothetical protein CY0110_17977 [Crocosphaera chwakensis CCY0110]|uniref:Uncharacterized protein n=1 Tax=Crocosphaera chwakensis CCY0110 TaxID=391612 RepID=A3IIS7_9CHRO|nr:hypothetical protein CY0110_17977 [Crocosphaera chwakensis CCY0110]
MTFLSKLKLTVNYLCYSNVPQDGKLILEMFSTSTLAY